MSRNEILVSLLQPKFSKYGRALQEGKDAIICGSSKVGTPQLALDSANIPGEEKAELLERENSENRERGLQEQ